MISIPDGFNLLAKYKQEVLSPLLPNILHTDGGFDNFGPNGSLSFDFFGDSNNFRNSRFEVSNSPQLSFIHFTKAINALNILKSKEVWFSKMANLNDQSEFVFADKYFQNSHSDFSTETKNQLFSLSCCIFNSETIHNESMWREYGDQHSGVCLKFQLIKTIYYEDIYLGRIQYAEDPIPELIDLKNRHDSFCDKNDMPLSAIGNSLYFISSFYKVRSKYQNEKEVRIIKYLQDCFDSSDDFYKLPILATDNQRSFLKIEDVVFGKKIDPLLKDSIRSAYSEYVNLG